MDLRALPVGFGLGCFGMFRNICMGWPSRHTGALRKVIKPSAFLAALLPENYGRTLSAFATQEPILQHCFNTVEPVHVLRVH